MPAEATCLVRSSRWRPLFCLVTPFLPPSASISGNHLPNKLLTFKSLSQGPPLEEPNLRLWD